jgi:hypothetical protein
MKSVLADIFSRSLALLSSGEHRCLAAEQVSQVDDNATLKTPVGAALIVGANGGKKEPVAVLVLTSPKLSPDHPALLNLAIVKARAQKAPHFITWTLRGAVLWKTPKPGTPAERSHLEKIREYEENFEITQGSDKQAFDEPVRLRTIAVGQTLLADLERLFKDQALELVRIDAIYFVQRLIDAVHELLPKVTDSLHLRFEAELELRAKFNEWAIAQGIAGSYHDRDYALSIARQIIYRLLGKIIFYQSLRRIARQLPPLDLSGVDSSQVLPTLRRAFADALKVDYHAVFSEDLPDTVAWPSEAAKRLAELIDVFNTRNFSTLPQDVIGTVFERLIPPEDRHLLGQYFTGEALCDIGIAFCVLAPHCFVADVTCGTGTFLIRAYDRKRWLGNQDHPVLLSQLWGIDVAPFPAELAVINLFRQNLTVAGNFPRIACRDFFTIKPGDALPFPPPKMDLAHPDQINEPIPCFDAIVGNFPYKGADQIQQKDSNYLDTLRRTLIEDWFETYPRLFCYLGKRDQEGLEKAIAADNYKDCSRAELQLRISSYADLYVYLFFHAARFLKPGGRMGIITSNAWLDVNYGYELQRFFCDQFKIVAVLESRCEPWFTEASVNTVYTILERCEDPKSRDRHLVKFVKVKKRLADLVTAEAQVQAMERWQQLRRFTERIEAAGRKDAKTVPLGVITEEDDYRRIRVCRQGELREELEREQKTVKWGRFLRAPEILFDIVHDGRLCPLKDLGKVAMGSKSGINEFYHLTLEQAESRGIESEFLKPILKSPGESHFIPIDKKLLDLRLFVCRLTQEQLAQKEKKGALSYIEWGERQVFESGAQQGLTWPNGAEVRVRKPAWYAIPEHRSKLAQVFFACAFGDRHMHRFCPVPVIADKRLYFLVPQHGVDDELLAAVMNSSLTAANTEIAGRVTMGDGVLELTVEEANDYLLVPDVRRATPTHKKAITSAFGALCKREIGNVFEEVKQKDRQVLDAVILTAIGLDPKKYLKPIYDALCELVQERISLGAQRGKLRKTKARKAKAEKESYQEVLDEILPEGPKRFPDDFLSSDAAKGERVEVVLPEAKLRLDVTPMVVSLYTDADKRLFGHQKSPAEGKFIVYCQQAGLPAALLPKKPVEVSRTVANYESYLRDLRRTLYDAFYRRTLDVSVAARLTQATFDRFKLPVIASQ